MKVQTRLSIFSSMAFGIIFVIISVLIYVLFYRNAIRSQYDILKKTSLITAIFFLEEDELDKDEFSNAKKQFDEFVSNPYYQIYNEIDSISYGSSLLPIPSDILNKIRQKRSLAFTYNDFYCYGIFYEDNQGDFVVITKEKKEDLEIQLQILLSILVLAFVIGIIVIIFLSRWMSHIAYRPFKTVIDQVNNISTQNLDRQIKIPNTKDELQDLIITFNDLLAKISETFNIQQNFVKYVSHEFKTPLASMMGNLEVFSIKDRTPEQYKQLSKELILQINQLEEILNTLIIISDLRNSSDITSQVRIDEVVWEIVFKISDQYKKANIYVDIEILPENETLLTISIDRTQLLIALFNLIENAVKYSNGKQIEIRIFKNEFTLGLSITDHGIGIPSEELKYISKPFYRADNTNQIQGSGIGLSIALRILEKNGIKYNIQSIENKGTTITLLF